MSETVFVRTDKIGLNAIKSELAMVRRKQNGYHMLHPETNLRYCHITYLTAYHEGAPTILVLYAQKHVDTDDGQVLHGFVLVGAPELVGNNNFCRFWLNYDGQRVTVTILWWQDPIEHKRLFRTMEPDW